MPISQINNLDLSLELDNENSKLISEGYADDPELAHIIKRLEDSDKDAFHDRYLWDPIGKKLYFIGPESARLCIPRGPVQLQLLKDSHDCLLSGHQGRDRTFSNLSQHFFWPRMSTDVKNFARSCEFCQRNKSGRIRPAFYNLCQFPEVCGQWLVWIWSWVCLKVDVAMTRFTLLLIS